MTVYIRTPASTANLGSGFDVFGLALALHADVGTGNPVAGAVALDEHHPAQLVFEQLGGQGPLWLRSSIPMARGLGFSGAVRVGAAALAIGGPSADPEATNATIAAGRRRILDAAVDHEGHGDNAAASLLGGLVAYVEGEIVPITVGPVLAAAEVVAWIPDVTTSTDRSRRTLPPTVPRAAAVHNIGRAVQLALAFEHDDPARLAGATDDRLHQTERLPLVPGATEALAAGREAGAWCGWLSGSGPTVALLCAPDVADRVVAALPDGGHAKRLAIATVGAHAVTDG